MAKTSQAPAPSSARNHQAASSDPTLLGRNFHRRLLSGPVQLGGIVLEYLRPSLVKLYRNAGFDFIYIENEHSLFNGPAMCDFVLSCRDNSIPVIAKVGQLHRWEVARLLESGVCGIQLPRTESGEQIRELLNYMRFPPRGSRAGAPCYGNVDYRAPRDDRRWMDLADQSTLAVAHIETAKGYANAEDIISTPGLGIVYVGPYDFSISMGHPGQYDHPDVRKPMLEILKLCVKHGVPFGTTASSPKAAAQWIAKGARFFEMIDETGLINRAANEIVGSYRKISPAK